MMKDLPLKHCVTSIAQLFNPTADNPAQFSLYMVRPYEWTSLQCARLYSDLCNLPGPHPRRYMGTLLDIHEYDIPLRETRVVDGQHRLLTILLFLIALRDYCSDHPDATDLTTTEINNYLFNMSMSDDSRMRYTVILEPARGLQYHDEDPHIFLRLLNHDTFGDLDTSHLLTNYRYFRKRLDQHRPFTRRDFLLITDRLQFIHVTLDNTTAYLQDIINAFNTVKASKTSRRVRHYLWRLCTPQEQQVLEHEWDYIESSIMTNHDNGHRRSTRTHQDRKNDTEGAKKVGLIKRLLQ